MKVVLTGFMGSGKSSVSVALAARLNIPVFEMDSRILELSDQEKISDIFSRHGEDEFRRLETEVCKEVSQRDNLVVSTGGGAVQNPDNVSLLRANGGVIVYLKADFSTILKRVGDTESRPLLHDLDAAKRLYQSREDVYESTSEHTVQTDNRTIQDVAQKVYELIMSTQ